MTDNLERVKQTGEVGVLAAELRRLVLAHKGVPPDQAVAALAHAIGFAMIVHRLPVSETVDAMLATMSEVMGRCVRTQARTH